MRWLTRGKLELYPFPHAVIENALPNERYRALVDTFPEEQILRKPHGENQRVDLHAKEAVKADISALWREFVFEHTSPAFWYDVISLFGDVIEFYYPHLAYLNKWTTAMRGQPGFLQMECQPGVNTPTSQEGRVRGPHLDNPIELYAGMLYMGEGEGNLNLYRIRRQPQFYGKLEIEDDCVEVVKTVKYAPNTAVFLLNTPASVHGVTPRSPTNECRRLINFAGEVPKPLYKVGHGKY